MSMLLYYFLKIIMGWCAMSARDYLDKIKHLWGLDTDEELAITLKTKKSNIDSWVKRDKIPDTWNKLLGQMSDKPTPPLQVNTVTATKLSPHVSAGNGSNIESIDSVEKMGEFVLDVCTFKTPPPKKLFAMQVDGYSMTPMIFPDSWVVFDDTTQFKGDGLYVINWRNVLMVKLLQVNSEGMIRIVSANKEYESYTVSPDDQSVFRIFGKVLRTII